MRTQASSRRRMPHGISGSGKASRSFFPQLSPCLLVIRRCNGCQQARALHRNICPGLLAEGWIGGQPYDGPCATLGIANAKPRQQPGDWTSKAEFTAEPGDVETRT